MRGDKKGLGSLMYCEWIYPVKDYFLSSSKSEIIFEIMMPVIVSIIITGVCATHKIVEAAVMAEVLITLISVLIGFSVMLVTLLLTSGGDGVKDLKEKNIEKKLYNKKISLYQKLHIQFVYSLISEIFLMISILLFYFMQSIVQNVVLECVFLFWFVAMTLNILLSIMRGITNIYFSYYANTK